MKCPKCGYAKFSITPRGFRCRRCTTLAACSHGLPAGECHLAHEEGPLSLTAHYPTVEQERTRVTEEGVDG